MKFGLYTLLIENHMKRSLAFSLYSNIFEFGWGNGYVLLPYNHPFYGVHYDILNINAHGGLTFSEKFKDTRFLKWVEGLEIDGDVTRENFKKFDGYWIIGFDTAHSGDDLITCSKEYVINETTNILEQCLSDDIENIEKYKSIYLRKDKLKKINIIK